MIPKILIIGSTGKLGVTLLNFCHKNRIIVNTITCFTNSILLNKQSSKYNIPNKFTLTKDEDLFNFQTLISHNHFDIIYFLNCGSGSLELLDQILLNIKNSMIAIANKEMIIAGGRLLIKRIKDSHNCFIPLDSEHFSLLNSNISNESIKKVYITASGGPLYFKKKLNLNKISKKIVLSHPKWKMGLNNLIDSSNFINKILEIFELSSIFNIDLEKIDFLISQEAYIHSIVEYKNNIITYNAFNNDMLITLVNPLSKYYDINLKINKSVLKNNKFFHIEKYNDNRFYIIKYLKKLKKINHHQQINFMILNNIAQNMYMANKISYIDIVPFIISKINFNVKNKKFRSFKEINLYIRSIKQKYTQYSNENN